MPAPTTHGVRRDQRLVRQGKVDGRTKLGRTHLAITDVLTTKLGGPDKVDDVKALLIQAAADAGAIYFSLRAWMFGLKEIVNEKGEMPPLITKYALAWQREWRRALGDFDSAIEPNDAPTVEQIEAEYAARANGPTTHDPATTQAVTPAAARTSSSDEGADNDA